MDVSKLTIRTGLRRRSSSDSGSPKSAGAANKMRGTDTLTLLCKTPLREFTNVWATAPPPSPKHPPQQPIDLPKNRSLDAVAWYLSEHHASDRSHIRKLMGSASDLPPEQRFLVSTVTAAEAGFLADYLDIPRQNTLHLDVRRLAKKPTRFAGRSGYIAVKTAASDFFAGIRNQVRSLTYLGHMAFHNDTPYLGRLPASELWSMARDTRPDHLNFFSCNSDIIASEVLERFVEHGHVVPQSTCFSGEVSPYPPPQKAHGSLRFFYGGPEVGPRSSALNIQSHSPILQHLRVMRSEPQAL